MLITIKDFDWGEDDDYQSLNYIFFELLIDSKKENIVGKIDLDEWSVTWGVTENFKEKYSVSKDINDGDILSLVLNKLGESLESELNIDLMDVHNINKNELIGYSINYIPNIEV